MKILLPVMSIIAVLSLVSCKQKKRSTTKSIRPTQEDVNLGNVVIFKGAIALNRDFGHGYMCESMPDPFNGTHIFRVI